MSIFNSKISILFSYIVSPYYFWLRHYLYTWDRYVLVCNRETQNGERWVSSLILHNHIFTKIYMSISQNIRICMISNINTTYVRTNYIKPASQYEYRSIYSINISPLFLFSLNFSHFVFTSQICIFRNHSRPSLMSSRTHSTYYL